MELSISRRRSAGERFEFLSKKKEGIFLYIYGGFLFASHLTKLRFHCRYRYVLHFTIFHDFLSFFRSSLSVIICIGP